jgi:hypothetical protein
MQSWIPLSDTEAAVKAGVRFGTVGTHTSRTMMLPELSDLLAAVPARAPASDGLAASQGDLFPATHVQPSLFQARLPSRDDYFQAILEDNVLGKDTAASRRGTLQRLSELYGLDPQLAVFRVLRRLWEVDGSGRPLLALLCALARDPLLRATAKAVLPLSPGSELSRSALYEALTADEEEEQQSRTDRLSSRFKPAILDKIARNAASSWAQAGHLEGRVRKIRKKVRPTAGSAAFALWLGHLQDLAGDYLLRTLWAAVLDVTQDELFDLALAAKQHGLLRAVSGGGVRAIDVAGLDPARESR